MKKVYCQPYGGKGKNQIACWYGKPPKGVFKYDVIKFKLCGLGDYFWVTPDEAIDIIRALSAGVHHFLVNNKMTKKIIDSKKE